MAWHVRPWGGAAAQGDRKEWGGTIIIRGPAPVAERDIRGDGGGDAIVPAIDEEGVVDECLRGRARVVLLGAVGEPWFDVE